MAGKITAVDLGSHSVKVMALKDGKHGLSVQSFAAFSAADADQGLGVAGIPLKNCVIGLAGREMTLRYTQVPPSADWQLANLIDLEIQDLSGQSGGQLSADYNLLPIEDEGGMDTILLALARDEGLDEQNATISGAGGSIAGHVPNCIGLYNAYLRCGQIDEDETVCLVNIGHETTDIAIVKGSDLLFVRNLASGGKVFDEAIASAFNVREKKAQELKRDLLDLDPFSRGRYASGQAEKVTMAAGGAGSMIVSAIQSSVAFCRSQTKIADLELGKVLICGGTARARGIRGMLREALRCPVEVFDPFESVDLSALSPTEAEDLETYRYESVVALGLAVSKIDDSLYSLEILPDAVKKKRNFLQKTVYNIGAAAVLLLMLGASFTTAKDTVAKIEKNDRKARGEKRRWENRTAEATAQIDKNAQSRALVEFLAERAVALDGVILTLRGLQDTLPEECWLESMTLTESAKSRQAKPVVTLKGKAKGVTGVDVTSVYTNFLSQFRALEFDGRKPEIVPVASSGGEYPFTWTIDYRPEPEPKTEEDT